MPNIACLLYLSATEPDGNVPLLRRWFRVGCVTYGDDDYETYFGRLGPRQRHPEFRTRDQAMKYATRELSAIRALGLPARIWAPLPRHAEGHHIHIAVLATYRQVRKFFPSEALVRQYGRLSASP